MKVLVLTHSSDDVHVEAVEKHLRSRGHELIRVDMDRIVSGQASITWDYQRRAILLTPEDGHDELNLLTVDSVWYRKPFGLGVKHGLLSHIHDPVQRSGVEKEIRAFIDSLCIALNDKRWMNRPRDIAQAQLKPCQLILAKQLGMRVPESIITTDPEEALEFCRQGPTIYKALATQQLEYGDGVYAVDTTLVTEQHYPHLHLVCQQPTLLQRYVPKAAELRVTCIGDEIFVARQTLLDDNATAPVDWRLIQGVSSSRYEPWQVSPRLEDQILMLVQAQNLRFAALDFAVDAKGQEWFLEINPNGQWYGYTESLGMPAAAAMARLLAP